MNGHALLEGWVRVGEGGTVSQQVRGAGVRTSARRRWARQGSAPASKLASKNTNMEVRQPLNAKREQACACRKLAGGGGQRGVGSGGAVPRSK
jgi:hypothetical protein